jgi:pantetheine-phosphate adenylyltransferase
MRKAMYAGTFDPFTNGHEDILLRSLELFDEVTILVAKSPSKKPLFTSDERVEMLRETYKDNDKIKVDSCDGLIVDYAKRNDIGTIIRGLRPTGDFEVEFQMASMNKKLYPEIETVFLATKGENYYVSSSLVKEVYKHGRDVAQFLPKNIIKWLEKKGRSSL